MKKIKLKKEVWKSDNNQEEIHYFVKGSQNEYLFGINPKYFNREDVAQIIKLCGLHLVIE